MMFKEVTLTGTPYERGRQYGAACVKEIALSMRTYEGLFARNRNMTWEQARKLSLLYLPAIRELDEAYVQEMQGIADGAGVTFEDILVINSRSELLYSNLPVDTTVPQECTAFSLLPPATQDGAVIVGQSWDYAPVQRDAVVIVRIPGEGDRPTLLFFPEAGMIGGKGCNNAGLSLTLNALRAKEYAIGVPVHIRMRRILECTTLDKAYEAAIKGEIPGPANLIMTHKDGLALDVELSPVGAEVLMPQQGVLVHSNHFIGPRLSALHRQASGSSYVRLQRAQQLFCGKTGLTVDDAQAALRDHKGYPTSICDHSSEHMPIEIADCATNFGLVMNLTRNEVWLAPGNPCQNPFVKIPL